MRRDYTTNDLNAEYFRNKRKKIEGILLGLVLLMMVLMAAVMVTQ